MNKTNPKVDGFLKKTKKWQDEMTKLRSIILDDHRLAEDMKWGNPCYMFANSNIVLIHGFKEYCALLFFKGALLKDPQSLLIQQTKNVQAARQIRFTSAQQIVKLKPVLKAYIQQAIEVEKAGLKVDFKKEPESVPEEFQKQLDKNPALKTAFAALTPGRQRGYILHFSQAQKAKTRASRVEKWMPHILNGKGIDDE